MTVKLAYLSNLGFRSTSEVLQGTAELWSTSVARNGIWIPMTGGLATDVFQTDRSHKITVASSNDQFVYSDGIRPKFTSRDYESIVTLTMEASLYNAWIGWTWGLSNSGSEELGTRGVGFFDAYSLGYYYREIADGHDATDRQKLLNMTYTTEADQLFNLSNVGITVSNPQLYQFQIALAVDPSNELLSLRSSFYVNKRLKSKSELVIGDSGYEMYTGEFSIHPFMYLSNGAWAKIYRMAMD